MPGKTDIEWTDFTSNPIVAHVNIDGPDPNGVDGKRGWHCVKVSEGCRNCYAERINQRFGTGLPYTQQSARMIKVGFNRREIKSLIHSKAIAGKRVFVGDMTDIFGPQVTLEMLDELFAIFALRGDVTFQLLTKRPQRMGEYLQRIAGDMTHLQRMAHEKGLVLRPPWPLPNVWAGTSVEDQPSADRRIPALLECPARVRFVSAEPLLGAVILRAAQSRENQKVTGIDWVICGGESGPGARGMNPVWVKALRLQCSCSGVPFFFKQWGRLSNNPDQCDPTARENAGDVKGGCMLDGRIWQDMPLQPRRADDDQQ